ncbi:hypothetical protein GGI20_000110 [Coemansia sp. BCRC 34301]|nr:hypothetical protein GGI20_000110 [Coemansia sp. BCRC 34301]
MSRLPRSPATAGTIRPPTSGLTLPRGLGSKDFLNDVPEMPALTQRIQPGSRRATLTAATFSPPSEGSAAIARSSGFAVALGSGKARAASPSPGMPKGAHSTLARERARSPAAHAFGALSPSTQRPRSGAAVDSAHLAATRPPSTAGLRCGDPVFIPSQGLRGTLRFLGPIDGKQGSWAGIELDEVGKGKNDGSVAGKSYFVCPPSTGIFAAPSKVEPCVVDQRVLAAEAENRPTSPLSLADHAAETGKLAHSVSRPGSTGRLGHSTHAQSGPQRAQGKLPGRSRFASDAQSPASASQHVGGTPALSSHARRKTMSRILQAKLQASRDHDRRRRAPFPEEQISVASNRTVSPQLSRPSSRSVASSLGDLAPAVGSPSRPPALVRPHAFGATPTLDPLPSSAAMSVKRRPATTTATASSASAHLLGSLGRGANDAPKPKTTTTADPVERLRLRIDMLEAENRVLRLKGEQDKAHLAASHMLARDLVTVNGTVSPQARGGVEGTLRASPPSTGISATTTEATAPAGISRQLGEARDMLERERQESKSQIALLEARIGELSLQGDSKGSEVAPSADESGMRIAELEAKLDIASQAHAKELLAAKDEQTKLLLELEARAATNKALATELEARAGEAASLGLRLKQADAERLRASQMFRELVAEHEQKADDSTEKTELVSKLGNQVERLRQELAESEEQRLSLLSSLEAAQSQLSTSEAKLADALASVAQLEGKIVDYDTKCALVGLYHSRLCQAIVLAQQHATSIGGAVADASLPEAQSEEAVLELYRKLQAAVVLLGNAALTSSQTQLDYTAHGGSADSVIGAGRNPDLQARIEELEDINDKLAKERDQATLQQTLVNDYLEKLESECNRLVEDIEQLTGENQKLSEDLRMASLQNSTISLDMSALDAKLGGEQADGGDNAANVESGHARELAAVQSELAEVQQRKDKEIKRLQDELGSLEDLIEDKIFGETELNEKIAALTREVERLERDLQRAQDSREATTTATGDCQGVDSRLVRTAISPKVRTEEPSDDESAYCDICDMRTHTIANCPQLQESPSIFKQEVAIDSTRPYCDNCEAFAGHWTDECPHGDEMF